MMNLYTKDGRPLQVLGNTIYSGNGIVIGRIQGKIVYGTDGFYVGSIEGNRLVYKHTDGSTINSPFSAANIGGSGKGNIGGSGMSGEEPNVPD